MASIACMPEISRFFGIVIRMHFDDHAPPHFHATYGGKEAVVGIAPPRLLEGAIHPRALGLVVEWAEMHRVELMADWARAQHAEPLDPIAPLG